MQIERTMRCLYYTPNRVAKIWNPGNTKYWQVCGITVSYIAEGNAKWYSQFRRQFDSFL